MRRRRSAVRASSTPEPPNATTSPSPSGGDGRWWAGCLLCEAIRMGGGGPDRRPYVRGERSSGGDHSTAGAQVAAGQLPKPLGQMLAFIIAGHHAGLADGPDLGARLARGPKPPTGWEAVAGALPAPVALRPPPLTLG